MKRIKKKIDNFAEKRSFYTEKTLRKNNLILLFSVSLLLFFHPLLRQFENKALIWDLIITIIVVSAINSLQFRKEKLIKLAYFGFLLLILLWTNHFVHSLETKLTSFIVLTLFVLYVTFSMVSHVARNKKVTAVILLNSINSYLLLGMALSFLFLLVDVWGELVYGLENATLNFGYTNDPQVFDFIYYGFITLTTVGYGDVTPIIPITRSLAMLTALLGQLYLTILVAMLVGKFSSNKN